MDRNQPDHTNPEEPAAAMPGQMSLSQEDLELIADRIAEQISHTPEELKVMADRIAEQIPLTQEDLEWIANRIAEQLAGLVPYSGYLTTEETARLMRRTTRWVYDHKVQLGAMKLGESHKAPLIFDVASVRQYAEERRLDGKHPSGAPQSRPAHKRRSRRPLIPEEDLIPILPRDLLDQ